VQYYVKSTKLQSTKFQKRGLHGFLADYTDSWRVTGIFGARLNDWILSDGRGLRGNQKK
jgi:hypothetical protein